MSIRECQRCNAATRSGNQCKNRTCMYSEFCAVHTRALFDLSLRKSTIRNAGKGLFVHKAIKKGAKIAKYTGILKTPAQYNSQPSGYGLFISKNRVMDGASTQAAIGRYANSCRPENKRRGECKGNNAKFAINNRTTPPTVWLRATKNIAAHSEIFIAYGKRYW